jgi:hypothetical protein
LEYRDNYFRAGLAMRVFAAIGGCVFIIFAGPRRARSAG